MMHELSSARSCKSQGQGDKLFSKFYKAPAMEAESVVHDAVIGLCGDRFVELLLCTETLPCRMLSIESFFSQVFTFYFSMICRKLGKEIKDNVEILDISPKRTQVLEKIGVCLTPGNVVWAKTACQMWWPAEVGYSFLVAPQYELGIIYVHFYFDNIYIPF